MANFLMIAASSSMGMATLDILEKNGDQVFKTARTAEKIQPDILLDAAESAAATYAASNLRFNVVSPGLTDTPLTKRIITNPNALKYSLNMHPLGRIGGVDDIARAVVFLLYPLNSWVTGQVLNVDGGLSSLKTQAS